MTKLDCITGFLGAGKTTFIRQYAAYLKRQGETFVIIENEFGAAGVDTAFLKEECFDVEEIAGGCICCSLKVNFHDAVLKLAGKYDHIIVEPSGIYNTDTYFDIVLSQQVQQGCELGIMAGVVDPASLWHMNEQDCTVLASELVSAGCILLSKTRYASSADIRDATRFLSDLLQDYSLDFDERTVQGLVKNLDWFSMSDKDFQEIEKCRPVLRAHERYDRDHRTLFQSTTMFPDACYTVSAIKNILRAVLDGSCGNILRIKGMVDGSAGKSISINCTSSDMLLNESPAHQKPMLNIIGRNLNRKRITALFDTGKSRE